MWRRRGSFGSASSSSSTSRHSDAGAQFNSITGYPSLTSNSFYTNDPRHNDRPLIFSLEVPSPGPLGLDLRAHHVERDKPQRGAVVKGFRPLAGGAKGYVETTGRVKVGDILQIIHQTFIDDLPFEQIVNHAMQLQKDPSAWPLRLEFRREPAQASTGEPYVKPRRSSFFRSSSTGNQSAPGAQDGSFQEKLTFFRGFFANRIATGGSAPKMQEKPQMPSLDVVNEMYRETLLKRGVPDDVMDELLRIETPENKWHVAWYARQHEENKENKDQSHVHEAEAMKLAESLVELKWDNKGLKDLEALLTKISCGSADWIQAFLTNFGLDYLTMKLPDPSPFPIEHSRYEKATKICKVILRILRSATHFSAGVEAITNVPGLVKRIALCFHTEDADLKKDTLQLLGVVCYNSAAGHQAVIEAFDHYKDAKGESIRFSCLKDALKSTRYSFSFKEDVLSFINIIVNKAIRLEDRLAIRSDFLALKMSGYFEEVRAKAVAVQRQRETLRGSLSGASGDTVHSTAPMPSPTLSSQVSANVETTRDTLTPDSTELPSRVREARFASIRSIRTSPQLLSKSAPPSPGERFESISLSSAGGSERSSLPLPGETNGKAVVSNSVEQLRSQLDNMEKQIDVFERFMEDDRKDTIYEQTDLASVESVFQSLANSIAGDRELELCFLSILQQLLFIPADRVVGKEMWALCERLMKQVGLLAPVEEVRNFELSYDDRKALLRLRDRYTEFLQKHSEEDPTFQYRIGPIILIENRRRETDDLTDEDDSGDDTDEEDETVMARDHPEWSKYFKLLKMGMPLPHVQLKMQSELGKEVDVGVLETPEKIITLKRKDSEAEASQPKGVPAKDHEKYAKFFKLKQMGMPGPHIELKMSSEGLDPAILETPDVLLDEDGNKISDAASQESTGIPAKEHELFKKFFKLLQMGMPLEHVKLKASSEGLDPSVLETPDKLLDAEGKEITRSDGVPVRDHELYAKYFKLLKMGMPVEQVKLKVSAEGLDSSLLDTPDELLDDQGQRIGSAGGEPGIPAKEHEKYSKYFRLIKMGMPLEQAKMKASADGVDASILDNPDQLVDKDGSVIAKDSEPKGIPVKEHEKYAKFFKLLKMGMPLEHVKLKVSSEGLHPEYLDSPEMLVDEDGNAITSEEQEPKGIPVKDHEKFAKFFKLLKMGMPIDHVKLKASSEGLDGSLLDTPDKLVDEDGKELTGKAPPKEIKASEHPSYAKFFKLMKMGMPRPQLELKMSAEGLDAKLLDTPDAMIPEQLTEAQSKANPSKPALPPPPPKPKLRNLYWEAVKEDNASGTIWDECEKDGREEKKLDDESSGQHKEAESSADPDKILSEYVDKLENLFAMKPAKPVETAPAASKKASSKRRAPTRVALIDVKRANNIGIMIARFRLPYAKIRNAVLEVDKGVLSIEKVLAMIHFAPEEAEIEAVKGYTGDPKLLGDAEQYFLEMLKVPRLVTRLQAIHATWQLDTYIEEQRKLMDTIRNACQELRACAHLRRIFKVVLSLGNALNEGTARGDAKGFRLSILLKLGQVKASDNSTTLLAFAAKILRATDPSTLHFDKDLASIESASRVTFQVLKAGEGAIKKAAALICSELDAHAKLPPTVIPKDEKDGDEAQDVRDRFQDVVKPFADRANSISQEIEAELEQTTAEFKKTVAFFGEDAESPECGPDSFFSIFYSFAKLLQSADRDNERKRIAEERRRRQEEATKKRMEQIKRTKSDRNYASLKEGDVDDIVMKIRAKRVAEKRKELLQMPFEEERARSTSRSSYGQASSRSSTDGHPQGQVEVA